jgi:inner membrane protein
MSSFIGHSLAALGINSSSIPSNQRFKKWWLAWLIFLATIPDIDRFVPFLRYTVSSDEKVRITHSIFLSLLLPFCTIGFLFFSGKRVRTLIQCSLQAIFAGLSHLILDLLTGVNLLPLLWPLSRENFKLPFGLLPSAGRPSLFNYFFYRNLFIELGVFFPLVCIAYLINSTASHTRIHKLKIAGLILISLCFMLWSFSLSR